MIFLFGQKLYYKHFYFQCSKFHYKFAVSPSNVEIQSCRSCTYQSAFEGEEVLLVKKACWTYMHYQVGFLVSISTKPTTTWCGGSLQPDFVMPRISRCRSQITTAKLCLGEGFQRCCHLVRHAGHRVVVRSCCYASDYKISFFLLCDHKLSEPPPMQHACSCITSMDGQVTKLRGLQQTHSRCTH